MTGQTLNYDRTRNGRSRRRGALTFELILISPLVLILLLAIVQFAFWLLACQAINGAAAIGARAAALPGATPQSVQTAVDRAVENWRFGDSVDPVQVRPADLSQIPTGAPVKVVVSVDIGAAVPDCLGKFGFDLGERKISGCFVASKE